jgi:uncharacterized membrane protein YeaQ/YmgE (transglycosylase-associated protein family)
VTVPRKGGLNVFSNVDCVGSAAGLIASKIVNKNGQDAFIAIVGAVVGGLAFGLFGAGRVSGFNLYSLIVAVIGVVATCLSYNAGPSTIRVPKPEPEQEKEPWIRCRWKSGPKLHNPPAIGGFLAATPSL